MKIRHHVVFVEYALLAGMVASTAAVGVLFFQQKLRALFLVIAQTATQN